MKTAPTAFEQNDERWLRARVDIIATSLPLTIVLNPIWSTLLTIPLGGMYPAFGSIPLYVLGGFVAMHIGNSMIALAILSYWRMGSASPRVMFRMLYVFQILVSSTWGLGAWAFWIDGNAANNTFLALTTIAMMWALALTRSVHPVLFAASLIPLMSLFWARALWGSGEAAQVFAFFTPVFAAYAWFLGLSQRDRVDQVLRARFENEDLVKSLELARNEALAKGAEAEAASLSKSAFVANMSHELRTPLNAILGFAEIIAEQSLGPNAGEQYRVYAQDIRDSGGHLLSLINDLLDVAKIESGRMELDRQNLDARYVIEAAMRFMALKAEARKQTIVLAADARAVPFADERAFKQIVLNLLSNAVKFAPENGRIVIKVTALTNGGACLTVEDDGPGIAPEKISQLFKPFSQADNRYDRNAGGTGLGLSLVFGLTALHGGRVWVENRAPGGLAAHVEFPPARARVRAA